LSFVYGGSNDRPAAVAKTAQHCRQMDARAQREVVSGPEADDLRLAKRRTYQQWYSRNKDKVAATKRRYYQNNTEKCLAADKLYYAKNKQKKKEAHNRWVEANRQKYIEYQRQYRAENREKMNTASRQWYVKNLEKVRRSNREYRLKNRNAILEKQRRRYKARKGDMPLAKQRKTPRTPPPRDAGEAQQESGSHAGPSRLTPHTLESNKKRDFPSKKKWEYQAWGCKKRTCPNCGIAITNSNYSSHLKRCRASSDWEVSHD
jgi:hypothetical protein